MLAVVAFARWLEERYDIIKKVSSAVVCTLLGITLANVGVIEHTGPAHEGVFTFAIPYAIVLVIMGTQMKELANAGRPLLIAYLAACGGSFVGGALRGRHHGRMGRAGDMEALGGVFGRLRGWRHELRRRGAGARSRTEHLRRGGSGRQHVDGPVPAVSGVAGRDSGGDVPAPKRSRAGGGIGHRSCGEGRSGGAGGDDAPPLDRHRHQHHRFRHPRRPAPRRALGGSAHQRNAGRSTSLHGRWVAPVRTGLLPERGSRSPLAHDHRAHRCAAAVGEEAARGRRCSPTSRCTSSSSRWVRLPIWRRSSTPAYPSSVS